MPVPGVELRPAGSVVCDFRERSFDLRVLPAAGAPRPGDRAVHRLRVPILAERILPDECAVRVKPGEVVLSLRKENAGYGWRELHKVKGIGETETLYPDSGVTVTKAK